MLQITKYYDPNEGLAVISENGFQRYTNDLNYYSNVSAEILTSSNNKFVTDSCWETGNLYYVSGNDVKKIDFHQVELASLELDDPTMVSTIQYSNVMSTTISFPPQEDQGCWIVEKGTGNVIKTDGSLNVLYEVGTFNNVVAIIASVDGGCYVVTEQYSDGNLIKISPVGLVEDIKNYGDFVPPITKFIDIKEDANGRLWLCANDMVYGFTFANSTITQFSLIDPFGRYYPFSSSSLSLSMSTSSMTSDSSSSSSSRNQHLSSTSSSEYESVLHMGSIDIDRSSVQQYLYITGGNEHSAFVYQYSLQVAPFPLLFQTYDNITYPYIIKVAQGYGSDAIYILEDTAKWDEDAYGSSSSTYAAKSSSSYSSRSIDD